MDAAVKLLSRHLPDIHIQSCLLTHEMLAYAPIETLHLHHTGANHYCISTSFGSKVSFYDSINSSPTQQLLQQITALYSPDNSIPESHQAVIIHPQEGSTCCGVFAIAYAFELALGNDPSLFVFDQSKMREHLLACFENRYVSPFPKSRRILTPSK